MSTRINTNKKESKLSGSIRRDPQTWWPTSHAEDHHFGRLDECGRDLAFLEAHFTDGVGGNDGSNMLVSDGEGHLGKESARLDVDHAAHKLVAPADPPEIAATLSDVEPRRNAVKKTVDFRLRHAVVTASGFDGAEFPLVNPLLEGWIADAQDLGGLARLD